MPKPKTTPTTFQKGICLEDTTIGGHTKFVKDQTVFLKQKPMRSKIEKLIFFGHGGGTGKGEARVDKYNKWYSLSTSQENNFKLLQLF